MLSDNFLRRWAVCACGVLIVSGVMAGGLIRQGTVSFAAEPADPPGGIRLVSGVVPTRLGGMPERSQAFNVVRRAMQALPPDERLPVIVQFDGLIASTQVEQWAQAGLRVAGYLPDNALVVLADALALDLVENDPARPWVGVYPAEYKIHPVLPDLLIMPFGAMPEEVVCDVVVFAPERTPAVAEAARRGGARIVSATAGPRRGLVRVGVRDLQVLRKLAEAPSVEWIERYVPPRLFNNVASEAPRMNVAAVHAAGLTGTGQVVAVCDTGLDLGDMANLHPDFTNRLLAAFAWGRTNQWDDPHGHGTHCAGSVLGDGSAWSNGLFKGVAWRAGLVFQSILTESGGLGLPDDLNEIFLQAYTNAARIHSDSWGSSINAYSASARQADEFVWAHPEMLILFAAGNDGADDDANGIIDAGSLGTPATAKNVLSVGAAQTHRPAGSGGYSARTCAGWGYPVNPIRDTYISSPWNGVNQGMAAFSSRGPCADGRIKPDIVAPGTDIVSCRSRVPGARPMWGTGAGVLNNSASNFYTFAGGTSMSTPLTAGAAALVREYYAVVHAHPSPSAALIKATLAAGARSLNPGQYGVGRYREITGGPRPNNVEGWGHVDLYATLFPGNNTLTNAFDDSQALRTGFADTYTVTPGVSNRLSIVLAWSDYPGSEASAVNLVNDLDLLITAPDGRVHYPNGGSGPDRLNNMEGVDIAAALPGAYVVQVIGHQVPFGPQPYALVMHEAPGGTPCDLLGAWHAPLSPHADSEVTVSAEVAVPASGGMSATLAWRIEDGTWNTQVMSLSNAWSGGALFAGVIPPLPAGSLAQYYVTVAGSGWSVTGTVANYTVQAPVLYVDQNGLQQPPYNSLALAFTNIQAAVEYANDDAVILVAPGHYRGNVTIEKALTLRSTGGFANTVIDGGGTGACLRGVGYVLIEGFTLTGGNGTEGGGAYLNMGTLRECLVTGNTAESGGGVYAYSAVLDRCRIEDNVAGTGGGVFLAMRSVASNCWVLNNTASDLGGGVLVYGSLPFSIPTMRNGIVAGNSASFGGGGGGLMGFVENTTFYQNAAPTGGGFCGLLYAVVNNSIFLENGPEEIAAAELIPDIPGTLLYNCSLANEPVGVGVRATNTVAGNPRLRDPRNHDFRLKPNSPCRDAGTNAVWMDGAVDMDGRPRLLNGVVDIGAYELPLRRDFPNFAASRNARGDFDGDGRMDPAVYHAASGFWRIAYSSRGYDVGENLFGGADWTPSPADFDGVRSTTAALYRAADGYWLAAGGSTRMGGAGWQPVTADFDGDGRCDPTVYHSASGSWRTLLSGSGYAASTAVFGGSAFMPVVADYDGDGRSDLGVYAATEGRWYVVLSSRPDVVQTLAFGLPGDVPVPADYDGDGLADPACFSPGSGRWLAMLSDSAYAPVALETAAGEWQPVHGDYDDDGMTDPALYQSGSGLWIAWLSGAGYAPASLRLGGPGWSVAQ